MDNFVTVDDIVTGLVDLTVKQSTEDTDDPKFNHQVRPGVLKSQCTSVRTVKVQVWKVYCVQVWCIPTHGKTLLCWVPADFVPTEKETEEYSKFERDDNCLDKVPKKTVLFNRRTLHNFDQRQRHLFLLSRLQRDLPLEKEKNFKMVFHLTHDVKLCSDAYEFVFHVSHNQLQSLKATLYSHGKK